MDDSPGSISITIIPYTVYSIQLPIIQDPGANYIWNALGDHWVTSGTLSGDSRGSLGDPRDSIRRLQGTTGMSQGLDLEGPGGPLGGSRGPLGDLRDSIWRIQGDHWEINFGIYFGIHFGVNFGTFWGTLGHDVA